MVLPKWKHPLKMECGVTGGYTNGATPAGILADVRSERSPSKTGLHVNFKEKSKEKREKFLTAKYGHHQMSLIRKRLAVEMWLYEELKNCTKLNQHIQDFLRSQPAEGIYTGDSGLRGVLSPS
ncbi:hypothetical protein NQ317_002830 [Molorchus minor]|uniref:Uncharacterized protein n=1 Tax=Molorchus minor TaxID=1323400 RepID=A0ABQ9IU96_9CUCU|nr:hypothetical protein NQ317_002830 [Molorchus minor]